MKELVTQIEDGTYEKKRSATSAPAADAGKNVAGVRVAETGKYTSEEAGPGNLAVSDTIVINTIPYGIYKHYKGNQYEVIGFARHSETLEDMVIYKAVNGEHGTWVRPLSMWNDPIEVDGKTVKRFEHTG